MSRQATWCLGLAFVALAGCMAAEPQTVTASEEPASIVAGAVDLEDAATLRGLVLDEQDLPLRGAQVGIPELSLLATTDEGGAFLFTNLPPGSFVVAAARLGYESASRRVDLVANEETTATFRLVGIVVEVAYSELHGPFFGFFTCKMGTPAQSTACGSVLLTNDVSFRTDDLLWKDDKAFQWFNLSAPNWRSFIGELEWTQGTFATAPKLRTSFSHERFGSHWFCASEGPSPRAFRFERDEVGEKPTCTGGNQGSINSMPEPNATKPLVIGFRVPFGGTSADNPPVYLAFQQKVTSYMTIFYGDKAKDTYSARPDR
jgi:hypothetical protein